MGQKIEIVDNKLCLSQADPARDVATSIKSIFLVDGMQLWLYLPASLLPFANFF